MCHLRWVQEPSVRLAVHVLLEVCVEFVVNGQRSSRISTKRETLCLIWIKWINIININENGNSRSCLVSRITFLDDQRLVVFSFIILISKIRRDNSSIISRGLKLTIFKYSHINDRII